jgi:hypothetical protein
MAVSPAFTWVSNEVARATSLNELEARGTVRLALKAAGLDARTVTTPQMVATLQKVMPNEMKVRGVDDAEQLCRKLVSALELAHPASAGANAESPEAIFRRLAQG